MPMKLPAHRPDTQCVWDWAKDRLDRRGFTIAHLNKVLKWDLRADEINKIFVKCQNIRVEKLDKIIHSLFDFLEEQWPDENIQHWMTEHVYSPDDISPVSERPEESPDQICARNKRIPTREILDTRWWLTESEKEEMLRPDPTTGQPRPMIL